MKNKIYIIAGSIICVVVIAFIFIAVSGKNKGITEQNASSNEIIDIMIQGDVGAVSGNATQVSGDSVLPDGDLDSNITEGSVSNNIDVNDAITVTDDNGNVYTVIPGDESNNETPIIGASQNNTAPGSTSSATENNGGQSGEVPSGNDDGTGNDAKEEVEAFETERIPLD